MATSVAIDRFQSVVGDENLSRQRAEEIGGCGNVSADVRRNRSQTGAEKSSKAPKFRALRW
jgi:hypothetical protein